MRKQASKPQNLREFLVTNLLQLPDAIVTLDFRLLVSLLLRGDWEVGIPAAHCDL